MSDNVLSDDAKWFIQIAAIWITLIVVLLRFWNRQPGGVFDNVSVNYKRWAAQHTSIRIKSDYTEYELLEIEKNAENLRKAYRLIQTSDGPTPCPWGRDCPEHKREKGDVYVPEQYTTEPEGHVVGAYNRRKQAIDTMRAERLGSRGSQPSAPPLLTAPPVAHAVVPGTVPCAGTGCTGKGCTGKVCTCGGPCTCTLDESHRLIMF